MAQNDPWRYAETFHTGWTVDSVSSELTGAEASNVVVPEGIRLGRPWMTDDAAASIHYLNLNAPDLWVALVIAGVTDNVTSIQVRDAHQASTTATGNLIGNMVKCEPFSQWIYVSHDGSQVILEDELAVALRFTMSAQDDLTVGLFRAVGADVDLLRYGPQRRPEKIWADPVVNDVIVKGHDGGEWVRPNKTQYRQRMEAVYSLIERSGMTASQIDALRIARRLQALRGYQPLLMCGNIFDPGADGYTVYGYQDALPSSECGNDGIVKLRTSIVEIVHE